MENNNSISVFGYFKKIVIFIIPLLGFFYSMVLSFKPNINNNIKNLSRAVLIIQIIFIIILLFSFWYIYNNIISPLLNSNYSYFNTYNSNSYENISNTYNQIKSYNNINIFDYFNSL